MKLNWTSTQEKAWHAVSMRNWKEAERHFRKAVKQAADLHPTAHLLALCDHALSLKKVGRIEEFEAVRASIRQMALSKFGVGVVSVCEQFFDACEAPDHIQPDVSHILDDMVARGKR